MSKVGRSDGREKNPLFIRQFSLHVRIVETNETIKKLVTVVTAGCCLSTRVKFQDTSPAKDLQVAGVRPSLVTIDKYTYILYIYT